MKHRILKKGLTASAAILAAAALLSGCGSGIEEVKIPSELQDPLEGYTSMRPRKITLMADTCMTWEDGLQKVCNEYQDRTGIELEIEKPDHNKYYERVAETFAAGTPCDVIEMGGNNYPIYAASGKLWDMSHAWEISKLNSLGIVDTKYINANYIDGKLYGFPIAKGKGTVTYIRKDILDKTGTAIPTNYDEFINMLRVFKANGIEYPLTAAGFINSDTPYNIFMPEFYQDANPDFIEKDGKYVDGMTEPEMREALQRMRDAYAEGLFDPEIMINETSGARDKFYSGKSACFNYWADWANKLQKYVAEKVPEAQVVPIDAISGVNYIERQSINFVINNDYSGSEERKQGIFDYLIAYSHDGGEGQLLFTRGVEGIHWQMNGDRREMLSVEKSYFDSTCSYVEGYDEFENVNIDPSVLYSIDILAKSSVIAPVVSVGNENTADIILEISNARTSAINDIVTGAVTIEQGLENYKAAVGDKVEAALRELNA